MVTKHKCFILYHQDDAKEVQAFMDAYDHIFTPKTLGVSDIDDFIDSDDTDYVMRRIRELYLTDSTVTIVLVGKCTWARKYVDWEIASSLRNDPNSKRSGLLAITLKSAANATDKRPPDRVDDNLLGKDHVDGYARWNVYPKSAAGLQSWIQAAFNRRDTVDPDNTRALRQRNGSC